MTEPMENSLQNSAEEAGGDALPRALRETEYAACLDLWTSVWGENHSPYFSRYLYGDHDFQPEYCRVVEADGRLVSAALIVKRRVGFGDFTLTMGGIANVATLPAYRGRGYATACLQQAVAVMEADALDFSLLFTGIPGFYRALGWETVPMPFLAGEIPDGTADGLAPRPASSFAGVVRPYQAEDDAAMQALYAAFQRTHTLTVVRTPYYWRDWIGTFGGASLFPAYVAEENGGVVGYVLCERHSETMRVLEAVVAPGCASALSALIESVIAECRKQGINSLLCRIPLEYVGTVSEVVPLTQEIDTSLSVRFLNPETLLGGLLPELTERWMREGMPAGELNFATPSGRFRLYVEGFLRVGVGESAEGNVLSQADLFALLCGQPAPELATLSHRERAFAAALFPPQSAHFGWLDRV